jgi:hypothetical protein
VQDGSQNHEAYLLFPVHLDGTLQDATKAMQEKKEHFPTITILQIFRQVNILLTAVFWRIQHFILIGQQQHAMVFSY